MLIELKITKFVTVDANKVKMVNPYSATDNEDTANNIIGTTKEKNWLYENSDDILREAESIEEEIEKI